MITAIEKVSIYLLALTIKLFIIIIIIIIIIMEFIALIHRCSKCFTM